MQSKLQAIAAALWQAAEETGKAGIHLDSQLAVACYVVDAVDDAVDVDVDAVDDNTRRLRLARRHCFPSPQETGVCRAVFGVPDTAESRSYIGKNAWHVWEFTWEFSNMSNAGRIPDILTLGDQGPQP